MEKNDLNKMYGSLITQEALRSYWTKYKQENNVTDSRERLNVVHRHAFSVIARENVRLSLNKIGSIIGRDHATVIHACKNHETNYRFDADYRSIYNTIALELQDMLLHNGVIPKTVSNTNEVREIHFKYLKVSRRLRQVLQEFEAYKDNIADDKKRIAATKRYIKNLESRNNQLNIECKRLKNLL